MDNEKILNAVSGWIIVHTRATDSVMFGPFSSIDDARTWMADEGVESGVRGIIVPIISPNADFDVKWAGAGSIIDAYYSLNV